MRFYTEATNSRGSKVKAGAHKEQEVHARGWSSGVKVYAFINKDGKDCFRLFKTSGSNGGASDVVIGEIVDDVFVPVVK